LMRRNGAAPGFSILLVQHTREMCTSCGIVCNAATTGGGLILVIRHGTEPGFPNSSHSSTAKRAHLNVNRPRPRGTNWQTDRHAETVRQTDFPNRPRTFPNWQICRAAQSQNQGKHSVFENGAEPGWQIDLPTRPRSRAAVGNEPPHRPRSGWLYALRRRSTYAGGFRLIYIEEASPGCR
jgi:hypothetical protein